MTQTLTKETFCNFDVSRLRIQIDSACESSQGVIEYKIICKIDDFQYETGKRYTQLKEFDKTLKYHFHGLVIPNFPSKFILINKIEYRKKGFNLYLVGLIEIFKTANIDQKVLFLKLLAEFLEIEGTQGCIEEERPKKSLKIGVPEMIQKPNVSTLFKGEIEMKLKDTWQKFYGSIQGDCLYLSESIDSGSFIYAISLFLGNLTISSENYLELNHDHQDLPICFRSPSNTALRDALLVACSSKTDSPLSNFRKNCVGRISVTLHSGHNLKIPKPPASVVKPHVYIGIDLDCLNFTSTVASQENEIHWGQTFIIISINYVTTEGWVKQHAKKETLEEIKIPLTDIDQPPYNEGTVVIYLNKFKAEKNNDGLANIILTIAQNNSFLSHFIPPAMNYVEESPLPNQATMHDLKIAFKRLKRVRILYFKAFQAVSNVFSWNYPDFTKLCIGFYTLMTLFLPANFILPLFLCCVLVFCLLMAPENKRILMKLEKMFFSKKKHIKPYPKVLTIKESTNIKKCQIEILKEKAQEGVIKRWKKFKEDAVELQNYLLLLACFGEKFRQIFLWENPKKSYLFCGGLLIVIIFLIVFPIRFVLFIGGMYRFYKGYKHTKRKIEYNKKVTEEVLNSLFKQYLSDSFIKPSSNDFWSKEILENNSIQKKIVEGIRTRLSLDINSDVFQRCKSPLELWNYLSSSGSILRLKDNKGELVYEHYSEKNQNFLRGFLTNVPSEFYRLEHPRLSNVESYY